MNLAKNINIKTIVFLNTFLFVMGFISIHANLPLYMKEFNISTSAIGTVVALNPLASLFLSIPFAVMSDKFNRKSVIFTGLILCVLSYAILLLSKDVLWFGIAKALEGAAIAAFIPTATAFISDLSLADQTTRNLGKLTAVINLGYLTSPLISAFIVKFYSINSVLVFLFFIAVINLLLSLLVLLNKEQRNRTKINQNTSKNVFSEIISFKILLAICILALFLGNAHGVIDAVWSIYMKDNGAQTWLINLSYTVYAIPVVLISTFIGKWADKNKNLSVPIMMGGLMFSISQIGFAFIPIPLVLALGTSIEGIGYAIFYPSSNTAIVNAVTENWKGRALGIFNFMRMGGRFVGALIGARLYIKSPMLPFLLNACLIFAGCLIAGISVPRKEINTHEKPPLISDQSEDFA